MNYLGYDLLVIAKESYAHCLWMRWVREKIALHLVSFQVCLRGVGLFNRLFALLEGPLCYISTGSG